MNPQGTQVRRVTLDKTAGLHRTYWNLGARSGRARTRAGGRRTSCRLDDASADERQAGQGAGGQGAGAQGAGRAGRTSGPGGAAAGQPDVAGGA
jgi:hypothetical protein